MMDYNFFISRKIKNSLFKIRNGDATKLEETYPLEVQPLASEINDLTSSTIIAKFKPCPLLPKEFIPTSLPD